MSTFTLDSIREAAEAQYGSTDIDLGGSVVKLLNPLRMTKAKRDGLVAASERLSAEGEDADQDAAFDEIFLLIAENEIAGQKLVDALDGDLGMKAVIFEKYQGGTQVGEASASQS